MNKAVPRAYAQLGRQVQAGMTRMLVLRAARDLVVESTQAAAFTLDAVAARAGVSRATVFNLFGGKAGLLNALFDEMSHRAGLMDVDALLTQDDARRALGEYVRAFADFYASEHALLKKLRAYAALDADFARLVEGREDKRTAGLEFLVNRLQGGGRVTLAQKRLAAKLKALLVLEVFEMLAASLTVAKAGEALMEMVVSVLDRDGRRVVRATRAAAHGCAARPVPS
ncbi:TetR/AcrR family transcriptional regulator [Caenimonas aquaedulcis]|uniref:TetR/AcrR family transcriptional regulator n=1 Tax=Caenimonas aquaedulcis TaxID=2793270 RepID=A0A931MGS9_9BURK|nr:TetR/AcrR family transcriptional regulator [Caenimonas aquaedulcis]MBG9388322.1 TetR/AcrR family transcriptional regulator [Caenimonas aquaedulcis]